MKHMNWRRLGASASLALACGGSSERVETAEEPLNPESAARRSAPCAELVPLGTPATVLTDIDRSGQMVVGFVQGESAFRAFRWPLDNRQVIELGDRMDAGVTLTTSAQATGVSANGDVVVGAWTRVGGMTAYRWTVALGYQRLERVAGAPDNASNTAYRASFDGSVIVGYANDGSVDRATRWQAGTAAYLPEFPVEPGGRAAASAVSDDGRVIVGVANQRAFRWTDAGGPTPLGSGAEESQALDVSADGDVVVGVDDARAFRWTSSAGLQLLDAAAPANEVSVATAVSADGQVVVGYRSTGEERHAFRWTAASGVVEDIDALLPAGAGEGWELSEARAVSGDGRVIGGIGLNPQDQSESWVAIVDLASCP